MLGSISSVSADQLTTRDEKMAPRNCNHTGTPQPDCPACKRKAEMVKKAAEAEARKQIAREQREESRRIFKRDVRLELDFMKSFGASARGEKLRKKAEKERSAINKLNRDTERKYAGPLIFTDEAREQETKRLDDLRIKYKRADARWTLVRRDARIKFLAWANRELEAKLRVKRVDLDIEHANLDVAYLELVDKAAERDFLREIYRGRKAGNGK